MNLQEQYKKLFKGRTSSNDKKLLSEAMAWERVPGKPLPTLKDVTEKYNKSVNEKFIPGQKYSSNFDYDGMLDYMKNIDFHNVDVEELEKVHASAEDVNYHSEASGLGWVIDSIKDGEMEEAEKLHAELIKLLDR